MVCENDKTIKELSQSNADLVNSSTKKRRKSDSNTLWEDAVVDEPIEEGPVDVPEEPQRTFGNAFAAPKEPFVATSLGVMELQEFIYHWYSKNLGTVIKNRETRIHTWLWCIPPGDKSINDKILDAKSIMKLTEMVASDEELETLRSPKPDAAKDSSYEVWEMKMKAVSKVISRLVGDFLLTKEDKVGNVKKMTVGALSRRWKNMKYLVPTETDLAAIRDKPKNTKVACVSSSSGSFGGKTSSETSSSSSSKKN